MKNLPVLGLDGGMLSNFSSDPIGNEHRAAAIEKYVTVDISTRYNFECKIPPTFVEDSILRHKNFKQKS